MRPFIWVLVFYLIIFFLLNKFFLDIRQYLLPKKSYYFIYTLLEYLAFTHLLCYNIRNKKFILFAVFVSCAFIIFLVIFYSTSQIRIIDSLPIGIETLIILVYIFYFFYEHFNQVTNQYIYDDPSFWFVIGILVYLGGTFFLNILANNLNDEHIHKYFYLSFLGDIIKNIMFAIAIVQYSRKPQNNINQKNNNLPFLDII